MTATITTTAAELYASCSTMQSLIASWVENRRCPLPLVDLLIENGLESQAEGARWAATEPDRKEFFDGEWESGPMPLRVDEDDWVFNDLFTNYFHCVPKEQVAVARQTEMKNGLQLQHKHKTAEVAILWLLDNWVL